MLDPRLYRLAWLPALLALLILAFSLGTRPRPIGTTLAPDGFDADRATALLDRMATRFPERRPGSDGDRDLARFVAAQLRTALGGDVAEQPLRGRTIDGERELVNVVATRVGRPGPGIVVVAHRDAAGRGARAELSGTAAMLELARVAGAGRLQRTITFISTSGGSGGFAGARAAAARLPRPVDAVIVLGDVGATNRVRPLVTGLSDGLGQAPLQLVRTAQAAIQAELGTWPGGQRALVQALRMAVPMTGGEQGPFLRAGLPAILISGTGEHPPPAGAAVSAGALGGLGRGALRMLYALDNGPDISAQGPTGALILRGKVVPAWILRLLALTLLLPALVVCVDGLARLLRRRERVLSWLGWALTPWLPIALCCVVLVALARTGLVTAPPAPIGGPLLRLSAGAIATIAVVVVVAVLVWLLARPLLVRALGLDPKQRPDEPAAGVAAATVLVVAALVLWALNPYAALVVVPAVHLGLWAAAPETGMHRLTAVVLLVAGLVLPLLVLVSGASAFGLGAIEVPWFWALLVAGGQQPWWAWLTWSLYWGGWLSVAIVVLRRSRNPDAPEQITVRGPSTYAGPGSLGGTESALWR